MRRVTGTTPLIALDAVAIDTETTGLDTARARIVQIGGIGIAAGRLVPDPTLETLVAPDVAIPSASSDIHGVTDAMVRDAPDFATAWAELLAFAHGRILIGHSIGFDLAVLEREVRRAGLAWKKPRSSVCPSAGRSRRAQPARLLAGNTGRLARHFHRRPSFCSWRRDRGGEHIPGAVVQAPRPQHPYARRGRARLPQPDHRTRQRASRRMDRSGLDPDRAGLPIGRSLRLSPSGGRTHEPPADRRPFVRGRQGGSQP